MTCPDRYPSRMNVCPVCNRHFDVNPIPEHRRQTMEAGSHNVTRCEASGLDVTDAGSLPIAKARHHLYGR